MTDVSSPSQPPLLLGRYRVFEQLGEGRLAAVYGATDERLRRRVLLHLLRKDLVGQEQLRARFVAEANASAQRSHPALLEVYDSGEASGRPYMITEYVEGPPLRVLGAFAPERALLYARQVIGAVALCQARSLPHPPISSSMVLLASEGQVKLVESWQLPATEQTLDLAHYRPPERSSGQPPTAAGTVYALGILLYELLTGVRPFQGDDARAVLQAHLGASIPSLSQVRPILYLPALDDLIARATARDPSARFPDAAALSAALDRFWRDRSGDTQPLAPEDLPRSPRRRPGVANPVRRRPATVPAPQPLPARPIQPATPAPVPAVHPTTGELHPLGRTELRQQALRRGITGWIVILTLALIVGIGSYALASVAFRNLFSIELPSLSLPNFGIELPPWLSGQPDLPVLVVNTTELNVRDRPGVNSNVIATVVAGTRVRQLEGPVVADGIAWVRVRTADSPSLVEGWVSLAYLKTEE